MKNRRHKNILFTCSLIIAVIMYPGLANAADDKTKAGDINRGAQQWANNCSRCHNMRDPKEFRDDLWAPVVLHMRVRAGLTGQQARDITAFLQSSNFLPSAVAPATMSSGLSGQEIYSQTCIACHGADGSGAMPGVPDFKERLSKSDDILFKHITEGFQTPGSPMAMPARGGNPNYTNQDLRETLSYIRNNFGK